MRACTSPNSLANLLQESPASVLQKTSPLTLLASRKSGSAACVARFQIVPLGASGNGGAPTPKCFDAKVTVLGGCGASNASDWSNDERPVTAHLARCGAFRRSSPG